MKKAFTLAEIMIVLVVIGVLTAILLPVAINSVPDENVMKFKKGNNTLGTVIRELVNSDEYYLNGDLGKKANGDWVVESDYFCSTFADIVSTKEAMCTRNVSASSNYKGYVAEDWYPKGFISIPISSYLDDKCKSETDIKDNYVVTSDDIVFYEIDSGLSFGFNGSGTGFECGHRNCYYFKWDKAGVDDAVNYNQTGSFYYTYKVFCMDVDGINKGEDPFGYGIRVDGKILAGARASEWIKKSVQKGE